MEEETEAEEIIDWNLGVTITSILSIVFGITLGLPTLLGKPAILTTPSIIFYVILYMFATVGHYDDITKPIITKKDVTNTLGGGLMGFLVIQVTFMLGLTLLTTPQPATLAVLSRNEAIVFNLGFVVPGEELIFRDTLPFVLFIIFRTAKLEDRDALVLGFVLSAILFGMLHFTAYNFNAIALLQAVIAGLVLSVLRIKFGLGASFMAHALFNVLNLLGLFMLPII